MGYSWQGRVMGEATKDYLARVLADVGLLDMSERAAKGHFDDYFCPPEVDDGQNMLRLVAELTENARLPAVEHGRRQRIKEMIRAVTSGEFDGTRQESEAWAKSPAGQAAFADLARVRR